MSQCYHLSTDDNQSLKQHLSLTAYAGDLPGFRHAGTKGTTFAVLVDKKKDLEAAIKGFDGKVTIEKGAPISDLDAEDAALAALKAEAAEKAAALLDTYLLPEDDSDGEA